MPLFRWLLLSPAVLLLALASPYARAADHVWQDIRSSHFRVITDAGESRGIEVVRHCEQMRAAFSILMPQARVDDPAPLLILALHGEQEVDEVTAAQRNSRHAGVFIPGNDANFIVFDATGNPWHTLFHEYAHELLHNNSSSATQTWFEEGFAEYFSTLETHERTIELGRVPLGELQFLREKGKLMRLSELAKVNQNSEIYTQNGPMQAMFYAQSWLLVHYLFDRELIGRAQTLFSMTGEGIAFEDAVPAALGKTRQQLEDELLSYAQGEQFHFFSLPWAAQPEKIEVKSLAEVSASALRLEAHQHCSPEYVKGNTGSFAAEYRRLLEQEPDNPDALRSLGVALMDSGNYHESLLYLQKAVELGGHDAHNHDALARLLNRMETNAAQLGETTITAEQQAQAALNLNPQYADALFIAGSAQARRGQLENAIALIRQASALSPRADAYKLAVANIEMKQSNYTPAIALLHQLVKSRDPEIAREAESFLSANTRQTAANK